MLAGLRARNSRTRATPTPYGKTRVFGMEELWSVGNEDQGVCSAWDNPRSDLSYSGVSSMSELSLGSEVCPAACSGEYVS